MQRGWAGCGGGHTLKRLRLLPGREPRVSGTIGFFLTEFA